jgi:hypothetical protein
VDKKIVSFIYADKLIFNFGFKQFLKAKKINLNQSKFLERKKFIKFSLKQNTFFYYKKMLRWFKFSNFKSYFFLGLNYYYERKHIIKYANIVRLKGKVAWRIQAHYDKAVAIENIFSMRSNYFKYYNRIKNNFFILRGGYYKRNNVLKKNTLIDQKIIFNLKINKNLSFFYLPILQNLKKNKNFANDWKNRNLLNLKNKPGLFFKFNKFLPKDVLKRFFLAKRYNKFRNVFDRSRRLFLLRRNQKLFSFFCKLKGKNNEKKKSMDFFAFSKKFFKMLSSKFENNKKFQTLQTNSFWAWIENVCEVKM